MNKRFWGIRAVARALLACVLACAAVGAAQADVTIAGTRIVYPAQQREVAVKLNNAGAKPALVQVWVDSGDPKQSPDTSTAPFLVSPPVVRIEAGKGQTLRLIHSAASADAAATPAQKPSAQESAAQESPTRKSPARESVYWLNVLEVPPGADPAAVADNQLQIAFRTRIKIFLRPPGLPGSAESAAQSLQWRVVRADDGAGYVLECSNASAFHVSFNRIALKAGDRDFRFDDAGMLAPGGRLKLVLAGLDKAPDAGTRVDYIVINDYGGRSELSGPIAE